MVLRVPFVGSLALTVKTSIEKVGTACTNGSWIKFDPDFCNGLSDDELLFLYAHEIGHKILLHPWRRNGRNPGKWNAAGDYVINLMLYELGLPMPKRGLLDHKYANMTTEEVYNKLPDSAEAPMADLVDADGSEDSMSEAEAQIEIQQAAGAARMMGTKASIIDRILGEALDSIVDYRSLLRRFLLDRANNQFSWSRPNRRFVHQRMFLPSRYSIELGTVGVGIDTSGSMGPKELAECGKELRALLMDARPQRTIVLYCDAEVHHVDTFEQGCEFVYRPKGGGGTSFVPVFDWFTQKNIKPTCLLYYTDLEGSFPQTEPGYATMWLTKEKHRAPFGETVRIRT